MWLDEETVRKINEYVTKVVKAPQVMRYFSAFVAQRTPEEIIDHVRENGLIYNTSTFRNAVLGGLELPRKRGITENMLKVGCACYGTILAVRYYCLLLEELGVDYAFLEKEYCCLVTLLYITLALGEGREKTDELARELQSKHIDEAHKRGAKNIIYYCHWCALRNKWFFPESDVNHLYHLDVLTQPRLWQDKELRLERTVGYFGGASHRLKTYVPDKNVDLNWEEYRKLLNRIEGLTIVDIPRYCCQVSLEPVWQFVEKNNLDTIVVSCPTCYGNFIRNTPPGIKIRSIPEILLGALGLAPR